MWIASLIIAGAAAFLAGCQEEPSGPRAMTFFEENDAAREEVLAACESGTQTGEECANALEAQKRIDFSRASEERQSLYESWGG